MPICPYFVSGKCNYGQKCFNDHINVCQLVQTEAKAAIYGKQWPLSGFGPFKDETGLPDFVQDQSFEEIRFAFFMAKAANTIPSFAESFKKMTTQAYEAYNKLAACDSSMQNYLVESYGVNRNQKNSNPFGRQATGLNEPASGGSIFDRISGGNSTTTNSNVFGQPQQHQQQPESNVFGGNSGQSLFGGDGNKFGQGSAASGGSIFGGSNQQTSSIFGQQQPQQQQNAFFKLPQLGNSQGMPAQPPSNSIFGGNQQAASGSNIFAQNSGGSIFGGAQNQSVFGQQAPQNAFQTPVQASSQNIFAQASAALPAFGQTETQTNPFQNQPQNNSVFGQQQSAAPPPQYPAQNVFGNPQTAQNQNAFATPFQNNPQTPQESGNVFGNLGQTAIQATQNTIFGQPQEQIPQQVPVNQNVFGQPQNQSLGNAGTDSKLYSKMEELNQEQIEAFSAPEFQLGKVPTAVPPRELCF